MYTLTNIYRRPLSTNVVELPSAGASLVSDLIRERHQFRNSQIIYDITVSLLKKESTETQVELDRSREFINYLHELLQKWKEGVQLDRNLGAQCIMCLSENSRYLVKPCNHLIFCADCKDEYLNRSKKCPICREDIECVEAIYA